MAEIGQLNNELLNVREQITLLHERVPVLGGYGHEIINLSKFNILFSFYYFSVTL